MCRDMCVSNKNGTDCSAMCYKCTKNATTGLHMCDNRTGICLNGCLEVYGGRNCTQNVRLQESNGVPLFILISGLLVMVCVLTAILRVVSNKGLEEELPGRYNNASGDESVETEWPLDTDDSECPVDSDDALEETNKEEPPLEKVESEPLDTNEEGAGNHSSVDYFPFTTSIYDHTKSPPKPKPKPNRNILSFFY